jgi:hypothetical protein
MYPSKLLRRRWAALYRPGAPHITFPVLKGCHLCLVIPLSMPSLCFNTVAYVLQGDDTDTYTQSYSNCILVHLQIIGGRDHSADKTKLALLASVNARHWVRFALLWSRVAHVAQQPCSYCRPLTWDGVILLLSRPVICTTPVKAIELRHKQSPPGIFQAKA